VAQLRKAKAQSKQALTFGQWRAAMTKSKRLMRLTCIAVLLFTAAPARGEFVITDEMISLVFQCGPAIITVTPDKKLQVTGLPYGNYPIDFKDDVLHIDGKPCKPICAAPAQRRC
jgi:hypothetical protein